MKNNKLLLINLSILLLTLTCIPALFADIWTDPFKESSLNTSLWRWNENLGASCKIDSGKITLAPKNDAWARAVLTSQKSFSFWNEEGIVLKLSGEIATTQENDGNDTTLFIGFSPDADPKGVQSADNVAGITFNYSKKNGSLEISLSGKEAQGENLKFRGDAKGNVPYYAYPSPKVSVSGDKAAFALTLRLDAQSIAAEIASLGYEQKFPHMLSKNLWLKGARLLVQQMNMGSGRAQLTIQKIEVVYPGLSEKHFVAVDLRPFANMGFKDETPGDGKGGWTDQGRNDLSYLKTGAQKIEGIPFEIADPARNQGKGCVMLYSTHQESSPKEVGPIPVGGKTHSLIFLHGAAWTKPGATAGTYEVTYADKTKQSIKIVVGKQVEDWWSLKQVNDERASLFLKVKSDESGKGMVGLYAYQWKNPYPDKTVESLRLLSENSDPILGVVAVTRVTTEITLAEEAILASSFSKNSEVDLRKDPPDKNLYSDQVEVRSKKTISDQAFSVAGYYTSAASSFGDAPDKWGDLVKTAGGMVRFPYGLEISFSFWPYEPKDWAVVLTNKGGTYGTISPWFHIWGDKSNSISIPKMLETAKAQGLKVILQFNCHSLFDGKDFLYVKTLPEEKMKRENPLDGGTFDEGNLKKILARNADLVDFVIKNGYTDTVAFWEMDNERWDMKGEEYGEVAARHIDMLKSKLPKAKAIVCLGDLSSYSANPEGVYYVKWSRAVLEKMASLGQTKKVDYFAPHLYPFLSDTTNDLHQNYLEDFAVRNLYRCLDVLEKMLDATGFKETKFFVSEWGAQSDGVASARRNDLLASMAGGLATAKTMMAIYSHPRVEAGTFHPFIHSSRVSRADKRPINAWGAQSVFYFAETRTYHPTPVLEAETMFVNFARKATFLPEKLKVPRGVHVIAAEDEKGKKYFVVNGTKDSVSFPDPNVKTRTSLFAASPASGPILRYGSYGDKDGDVSWIVPKDFSDAVLPPYSVNVLK